MNQLRAVLHWVTLRLNIVLALIVISVLVLVVWFVVNGFTSDAVKVSVGIAALAALFAAISAWAMLLQLDEIRRQREGAERPYVVASFDGASNGAVYFVVENFGNSPAIDLRVRFDPVPIDIQNRPLDQVSLFKYPISFLQPQKHFRQIVDIGRRFLADGKPLKYVVKMSYYSVQRRHFSETIELDLAYLKQVTLPQKSVEDNLAALSVELKKLADAVDKIMSGQATLLVESPDESLRRGLKQFDDSTDLPSWKAYLRDLLRRLLVRLEK